MLSACLRSSRAVLSPSRKRRELEWLSRSDALPPVPGCAYRTRSHGHVHAHVHVHVARAVTHVLVAQIVSSTDLVFSLILPMRTL